MRWSFSPTNGTIFSLFSPKIETSCQQNKKKFRSWTSDTVWHEIFAGSNSYDFAIFPAIRKNNSPPKKLRETFFPQKFTLDLVLNILWLKFTTQKYSTKKSCLFNYNSPLQFRNKTVYNELVLHNVRISITRWLHVTRTKILSMLGTGYFLKINSQQQRPMGPSVVNAVRLFFTISQF